MYKIPGESEMALPLSTYPKDVNRHERGMPGKTSRKVGKMPCFQYSRKNCVAGYDPGISNVAVPRNVDDKSLVHNEPVHRHHVGML